MPTAHKVRRAGSRTSVSHAKGHEFVGTSIELFTGGGGLAWAMHEAGFRHVLTNEFNPRACETLLANMAVPLGHEGTGDAWPLTPGDVRDVNFSAFEGKVDVLAGGPPCQPFSLGGVHRGFEDERNMFPEMFRAMREVRPRAVVCENVVGLLRPTFRPYFEYILRALSAPFEERKPDEDWYDHDARLTDALKGGYLHPSERYDVYSTPVNAADYGVPQVRRRVIIVAFRADLGVAWQTPERTHSERSLMASLQDGSYWSEHDIRARPEAMPTRCVEPDGLARWRTLRDAIGDLPEPIEREDYPGLLHHIGWPGARIYKGHTPNCLDRPAKTVKAGVHGVPGGETVLLKDDGTIRYMSVREVARVMTFPDHWTLRGPRGEQMRQLGNAVPVRLGRVFSDAVAQSLRLSPPTP